MMNLAERPLGICNDESLDPRRILHPARVY
jgi:hypothetical protein